MDRNRLNRFLDLPLRELPLDQPVFVSPSDSIQTALDRMREGSRSCVLVGTTDDLQGIITERDILTDCMAPGFDWAQPAGGNVGTSGPRTIGAERTVAEAIAIFQQHSYRTLPVVEGGHVAGLIRVGDVLTHLAEAFPEEVLNLPPRPHQVAEKQEGG